MFQKAVKSKSLLRCAVFGPAGAGKTFSSLSIASGMGKKIALIDSERGSAAKYADRFEFDTAELDKKKIENYVQYIQEAGKAGYEVLIIDSLSHAWQELLEEVDKLANAKYRGNTWSAWSEGTPKQRQLVDAILQFPGHVIVTMRSKTEWTTTTDDRGKSKPTRVGLSPEQGKGIEYEFDLLLELSTDHICHVIKDRTGKFQDKLFEKPGRDFGEELVAWLNSGEDRKKPVDNRLQKEPAGQPETQVESDPKVKEWAKWKADKYPSVRDGITESMRLLELEKGEVKAVGAQMKQMIDAMDWRSLEDLQQQLWDRAQEHTKEAVGDGEEELF